jgi:modulator of FtsH protease HflC
MLSYNPDRVRWGVAAIVVLTILLSSLLFSVPEGSLAVVTRFGAPVRVYRQAGLHTKLPLPFERAYVLDARKRLFETRLTETLTSDKKNVVLVTYAVWRIADPVRFLQAVGSTEGAEAKLDGVITNAKNAVLGHYGFSALVSKNPQEQRLDQIEQEMLADVRDEALNRYGVDLLQVGFQRLALPEDNTKYVFDEMRAERAQYAARFRAEGEREAARIRAETDLTTARLRADGAEQAEKIRGNAEAEAARVYAAAHKQDPEFYRFVRSLDSLKKMLGDNATVVLDTDSPPFNVLKHPGR